MRPEITHSRRGFLKGALAAATALAASPLKARAQAQPQKSLLAAVKGSNGEKMVRRALELIGGVEKFILPGAQVVVKPNASFANPPGWGNNTSPELLIAVCRLAREAGARKITVVDYPLFQGAEALELNGVAPACRELAGVELKVLEKEHHFRTVEVPGGVALKQVDVCREVLDCDCLINLPVAKAHDAVAASVGLKNLMGVIWDRAAFHTLLEINQAISDLARAVRPQLTLVDMTRVMVSNGPKGPGEVLEPGLVVASTDPVAADAFAVSELRFGGRRLRPAQLKYLRLSAAAGLGRIDPAEIEILREAV